MAAISKDKLPKPPTVDVIVPSMRPDRIGWMLYLFEQGTVHPDQITIVSNHDIDPSHEIGALDLNVRQLRFRSRRYAIGDGDVSLRRNIGLWNTTCDHVLYFDDDQLPPAEMVERAVELTMRPDWRGHAWGHHRYVKGLDKWALDDVLHAQPERGRPRGDYGEGHAFCATEERASANVTHGWSCCFGGLMIAEAALLRRAGSFDLLYTRGSEDQELGLRLTNNETDKGRVFIHEPPFAWHPELDERWTTTPEPHGNVCPMGQHELAEERTMGVIFSKCLHCPMVIPEKPLRLYDWRHGGAAPALTVATWGPILMFDPANVTVEEVKFT